MQAFARVAMAAERASTEAISAATLVRLSAQDLSVHTFEYALEGPHAQVNIAEA